MISKVLNAKNGVITEERFQKMTIPQWIFHYEEIIKHENEDLNLKKTEFEFFDNAFRLIMDRIELMYYLIQPESAKDLYNELHSEHKQQEEKEVVELMDNVIKNTPDTIIVKNVFDDENKFILPKFKRTKKKSQKKRPTKKDVGLKF